MTTRSTPSTLLVLLFVLFVCGTTLVVFRVLLTLARRRRSRMPSFDSVDRGFAVMPELKEPQRVQPLANDGPGRYRVVGVVAATGEDTKLHLDAETHANAKVKAELKGVVVTDIDRE